MRRRPLGFYALILLLGAVIGSILGQLVGMVVPEGVVKEFLTRSATIVTLSPTTVGPEWLHFTFGLHLTISACGVIGVIIAAYILRLVR
ncbi:MAG: hypothetical protein QHJ34_12630 [bacterium]|nr:hypothetical protein [candidate division KSB1 bacterium]MDH7561057.1 hypothetical protein [bacterium]